MEDDDYVPTAQYAAQAEQMSGAPRPQSGMAPYPLYGLQAMGDGEDAAIPFWKKPMFCYVVGGAAGFGLGYAFFGWFKPKFMRKNTGKKTKKSAEE